MLVESYSHQQNYSILRECWCSTFPFFNLRLEDKLVTLISAVYFQRFYSFVETCEYKSKCTWENLELFRRAQIVHFLQQEYQRKSKLQYEKQFAAILFFWSEKSAQDNKQSNF